MLLLYAAGAMVAMLISGAVYNRTGAGRLFIIGLLLHSGGYRTVCPDRQPHTVIFHRPDLFADWYHRRKLCTKPPHCMIFTEHS